jgi:hypothetical protein
MAHASLAELQAKLHHAAITFAHREAQAAIKRQLQAQGRRKPSQVPMREIALAAKEYPAAHPKLIAEAKPIVEQWRREGFFGKRAARIAERNSQVTSKEERTATQGLLLNESHAHAQSRRGNASLQRKAVRD